MTVKQHRQTQFYKVAMLSISNSILRRSVRIRIQMFDHTRNQVILEHSTHKLFSSIALKNFIFAAKLIFHPFMQRNESRIEC